MFGLPPASVLELPDPEEHGRSLLHRAAHAGRPKLCKAVLNVGADPLRRVPMLEPLRGTAAHVGNLLDECEDAAELLKRLGT